MTVGCFQTIAPFYLPRLLTDFAARYPAVRVSLLEREIQELQHALFTGACEVALLYDLDLDGQLDTELLAEAPPYVIVPAEHRLAARPGLWLSDLADAPMVLLDLPHSREYFQALVRRTGVESRIAYRTYSFETVRALVAAGHGFALLNQCPAAAMTYDGGRVATLPLLDDLPALPVVLARVRGVRPTARAQKFIERCRVVLGQAPPTCHGTHR